jgi:hypothetical protein
MAKSYSRILADIGLLSNGDGYSNLYWVINESITRDGEEDSSRGLESNQPLA